MANTAKLWILWITLHAPGQQASEVIQLGKPMSEAKCMKLADRCFTELKREYQHLRGCVCTEAQEENAK